MRMTLRATITALLVLTAGLAGADADDGTLKVLIHEANVLKKNNDAAFSEQQDLYVYSSIDYFPILIHAAKISNRDHASWNPPGYDEKLVPGKNQRYFDLYFELWDDDFQCLGCGDDDDFDISRQNGPPPPLINNHLVPGAYLSIPTGGFPHVNYDVCTGRMEVKAPISGPWIPIGANKVELNGENTSSGTFNNWAKLRIEVQREPSNWLPEDVAIDSAEIVQSVYGAAKAVHDKETSLIVRISSTYPFSISAPIIGQLTDGITTAVDTRTILINGGTPAQPGQTLVALFDGSTAPPYRPQKSFVAGTGKVSGWAQIDYQETISPNAPPQLMDCANENNIAVATDLPLMHSSDLLTLYQMFDYEEDLSFITSQQHTDMFNREEQLRIASWPLAALNSSPTYNQSWWNHGSGSFCPFEPFCALLYANKTAALAGIDRWVLAVRNGWFGQNAFRHQFIAQGSIGYSLGTFAPHAVLAEDGFFGVAVHELGHTYALSQRQCSNGGILNLCFDEYTHPFSDGRPYEALGYDVRAGAFPSQAIYPNGYHATQMDWPGIVCPSAAPQGRDICAANIMDSSPSAGYRTWLDAFSFHYLLEDALPHSDPPVVHVAGFVRLPAGIGDPTMPPLLEGTLIPFSYQFMGVEDFREAPLSPMGEDFSGVGPFRIRLVTPSGVRDYRFDPRMLDDPGRSDLVAPFGVNVPWDPTTMEIHLIGPVDLREERCRAAFCPGNEMILAGLAVTPMPPRASDLRAGRDAAAPPPMPGMPPPAPTIGPGHSAVVSWEASDVDSPELRSTLILVGSDAAGGGAGPIVPIALDIQGNSFTIPHDRMAGTPGSYAGRLFVSDGVNTSELYQGPLFTICNLANGGVEICNGLDDDCDGIVDNGVGPGPVSSVALNPQPLPPGGGAASPLLDWMAEPLATAYDVVYGDVQALLDTGGDFTTAVLGCLAEDLTGTSVEINPGPTGGQAFFFLVRGGNCIGPGTWNEVNPGPTGADRDPGINASPAACQP